MLKYFIIFATYCTVAFHVVYKHRFCLSPPFQYKVSRPYGLASTLSVPFAVGHEIAHIFGASHDDETHRQYGTRPRFEYGRGYLLKRMGGRTIMS